MKKVLRSAVCIIFILFSILSNETIGALAASSQESSFSYYLEGNKAVISSYLGTGENVRVPHAIDHYEVIAVTAAFEDNTVLKEVIIEEGIEKIGVDSFRGCSNLQRIVLPSTLRVIEQCAFYGCDSLKTITFPNRLEEIDDWAFGYSGLKKVVLPENVKTVYSYAFANTFSLHTLIIQSENTDIFTFAFENSALRAVKIPNERFSYRKDAFGRSVNVTDESIEFGFYAVFGELLDYLKSMDKSSAYIMIFSGGFALFLMILVFTYIGLKMGDWIVKKCVPEVKHYHQTQRLFIQSVCSEESYDSMNYTPKYSKPKYILLNCLVIIAAVLLIIIFVFISSNIVKNFTVAFWVSIALDLVLLIVFIVALVFGIKLCLKAFSKINCKTRIKVKREKR